MRDQEERKEAYRAAVKEYGLKKHLLARLHKVSENVVDKWLYAEARYPDFQAIMELELFIRRLSGSGDVALEKIITKVKSRVYGLINSLDTNPITGGEVVKGRNGVREHHYRLNGEMVTVKDIVNKSGLSSFTVRQRLMGFNVGDDISHVDFTRRQNSGRKKAAKYIYHSNEYTITELVKKLDINQETLRSALRRYKIPSGSDLTEFIDNPTRQKGPKPKTYILNGSELTVNDIVQQTNSTKVVVRSRIKEANISPGEDVSNIDFSLKTSGFDARKYVYKSKTYTVPELAGLLGFQAAQIYSALKLKNVQPGDDITAIFSD